MRNNQHQRYRLLCVLALLSCCVLINVPSFSYGQESPAVTATTNAGVQNPTTDAAAPTLPGDESAASAAPESTAEHPTSQEFPDDTQVPASNESAAPAAEAIAPEPSTTTPIIIEATPTPPSVIAKDAPAVSPQDYTDQALLQGLNKITARTSPLVVKMGQTVTFGNLEITLHACWLAPPEQEPESKSLLSIWEEVPGEAKKQLFNGWMFASSPAVSALEHPIYDVTLVACQRSEQATSSATGDTPDANTAPTTPDTKAPEQTAPVIAKDKSSKKAESPAKKQ